MTNKTKKVPKKPKTGKAKKHKTIQRSNRIERPAGLTTIMRRYHTTDNDELKQRTLELAQQLILNRYVQEGLTLNGQSVGIDYLSAYLLCDKRTIMSRMTEGAKMVLGIEGSDAKEAYRALVGLISEQALRDRGLVHKQVQNLIKAQGDKYVPFLTSAVNQSLDILLKTNKPLLDLLKTLSGPTTAIQINNTQPETPSGVPGEKAIGPNEAVMIINQQRDGISLLENDRDKLELFQNYIASTSLPEVIATKQIGGAGDVLQATYKPTKLKKHSTRNPGVYPAE